jgi:hypothetical protein
MVEAKKRRGQKGRDEGEDVGPVFDNVAHDNKKGERTSQDQ